MESRLNSAWWWFLYSETTDSRYNKVAKSMVLRCLNKALLFAESTQIEQIHLLIKAV